MCLERNEVRLEKNKSSPYRGMSQEKRSLRSGGISRTSSLSEHERLPRAELNSTRGLAACEFLRGAGKKNGGPAAKYRSLPNLASYAR